MLSDEILEKVIERLTNRIEEGNTYVLRKIGANIKRIGKAKASDLIKLEQMLKYGGDYEKIAQKLAKITEINIKDIKKIFRVAAKKDYDFAKKFYKYRNAKYIPFDENVALKSQIDALANITASDYVNIANTRAIGFSIKDIRGNTIFQSLDNTYRNVIDEAVLSVSQGKSTFDEQMYKIIKELGTSGLKTINFASGRAVRLDSAIRMNMRGALRNLHNEMQEQLGEEFDSDGVEISVHSNPAPDHALVQGRQFSNEEFNKFQNDQDAVSYDGIKFPAESEETGHDRRSISEYNCYHYIFAIVLGVNKPEYSNKELKKIINKTNEEIEIDGRKYDHYEATQLQRQLETKIREQKDIQIMAKEAGNDLLAGEAQNKIRVLTKKYKEVSQKADLPTYMERMRVSGYRRSASASAAYTEQINKMKVGTFDVSQYTNKMNPTTSDVILTSKSRKHIFEDHAKDAPKYFDRMQDVLNNYDNVYIENAQKNTIWLTKQYDDYNLKLVIKINETSLYQKKKLGYKNGVITFHPMRKNYLKNALDKKKIEKIN